MNVHIVGVLGNMGKRYWSCLKYLQTLKPEILLTGSDISEPIPVDKTHYIICTPTEDHSQTIQYLLYETKGEVLCEKPITKVQEEIDELNYLHEAKLKRLRMVNQYRYIYKEAIQTLKGSGYNYFNSGKDGIAWDCINIMGLDNTGDVTLSNGSPIWQMWLNGHRINRTDVDQAYIKMLWEWLSGRSEDNWEYIVKSHAKVHEWQSKLS